MPDVPAPDGAVYSHEYDRHGRLVRINLKDGRVLRPGRDFPDHHDSASSEPLRKEARTGA